MPQSIENFREAIALEIEMDVLPLTRVVTPFGLAAGMLAIENYRIHPVHVDTEKVGLKLVSVHPNGNIVIENHSSLYVMSRQGVSALTACPRQCYAYFLAEDRISDLAGQENEGAEQWHLRRAMDVHVDLTMAEPKEDFFLPGNTEAQDNLREMLRDHRVLGRAAQLAIWGLEQRS